MSYEDGWAAMNLEMGGRIPRTEYSATMHWELIKAVTGIEVGVSSSPDEQSRAALAFMRAWNFDFFWSTLIGDDEFGAWRTDMGHAEYAAGGVDRRDTIFTPYRDASDVLRFDPWEKLGRKDPAELTRRFEKHYRQNAATHPEGVNMSGVYVTMMSAMIGLFGWELLLEAAGLNPREFGALCNRYASWIQQYFDALAAADLPCVMVHDDMVWTSGAIMRPAFYREYIFPNYKKMIAPLLESGKKVMFTSDGNYSKFIDDIAGCGFSGMVMEPMTDLAYAVEKYGQTHVLFGNADTRILLSGTKEEIRAEVERCMNLGKRCRGFFMAVGNHIPPNTPVESALYYNDCYEKLARR